MTIFSCQNCGAQYPKWQGRCNDCGRWGSLGTEAETAVGGAKKASQEILQSYAGKIKVTAMSDLKEKKLERLKTNLAEFDQILGGGLVPGSLVLLAGEPGIGKSTLVLQIIAALKQPTLYLAGEESPEQIKNRADRLGIAPEINFLAQPTTEQAIAAIEKLKPKILIADSIQTISSELIDSPAGSLSQVRACASMLLETCKRNSTTGILVGQVTKEGLIAGPKSLEHLVDTVVYLEGDSLQNFRLIRVTKNRFGPVDEISVMSMGAKGLEVVENPSAIFLGEQTKEAKEGSIITAVVDGQKTFLLEIQALVTPTSFGYPQRRSSGFDNNRLQLLLAVLAKRAGLAKLNNSDVHINVAGGYKIVEPAADLAICLAVASSLLDKSFPHGTLAFGEVGLGGEIRPVKRVETRTKEARKLGFEKIIALPAIKNVEQAIKLLA